MLVLGPLGFTAPWLLLGLVALPILWILLRAVPPAPIRRRFPGVILLLGLADDDTVTDRTPWWLLLLRTLAIAAVILGFAGPVLNPDRDGTAGSGPLLVLLDGSWGEARDWPARLDRIGALLDEAGRDGRPVALAQLTAPAEALQFQTAEALKARLPSLAPQPWLASEAGVAAWGEVLEGRFDTFWMSDGLAQPWRAELLDRLAAAGSVRVFQGGRGVTVLRPAGYADGALLLRGARGGTEGAEVAPVTLWGRDPAGTVRVLARADLRFEPGAAEAETAVTLPPELRNRITRFEIEGVRSAGAVSLGDDALRRREVALISGRDDREGLELLAPTHYLDKALAPTADLIGGALSDILPANPDAVVMADVATLAAAEAADVLAWVEAGGLLVRFAGPRLAASDVSRDAEDPLMPVRLRAGGRNVGGAMSWGEPKGLRPFAADSPFFGLDVPADVTVSAQVMAQPDATLAGRTIASLADGTPLVTAKRIGQGQVVLVHTTANAEWTTLPLSGLFVQMLERLAVSTRPAAPTAEELAGTTWVPDQVLTAFGTVEDAGARPGVAGEDLARGVPGPDLRPGLYAGDDRRLALNAVGPETEIAAAAWPAGIAVEGLAVLRETPLKGWLLTAALAALMVDILASLWLAGRLGRGLGGRGLGGRGLGGRGLGGTTVALAAALLLPQPVPAQSAPAAPPAAAPAPAPAAPEPGAAPDPAAIARALEATTEVVLAHVLTGDAALDRVAQAGLSGLSRVLFDRTSIEPAAPIGVNLETDELAFYPVLYWPVSADQPIPSDEAYARLNTYLRSGGMIVFDTRDADIARFGGSGGGGSPAGRRLQQLAAPLDIPPLEPVPDDHVLTRTFYLLQDFPGRHSGRDVWVEAAPPDAEQADGMPFRNLNDNVTPVVIGGNDWASAWAVGEGGRPLYPVGRGYAGERQREIAYRFGVNLVMHVLTGNYKSDQVHVPALLDRLGN